MDENKGGIFVMVNRTTVCVAENNVIPDSDSGHYNIRVVSARYWSWNDFTLKANDAENTKCVSLSPLTLGSGFYRKPGFQTYSRLVTYQASDGIVLIGILLESEEGPRWMSRLCTAIAYVIYSPQKLTSAVLARSPKVAKVSTLGDSSIII